MQAEWDVLEVTQERRQQLFDRLSRFNSHTCVSPEPAVQKQGSETADFVKLFKGISGRKELKYVEPKAMKKGKNLRDEEHPIRLYRIGGKKNFWLTEIEPSSELNASDVYVLDADDKIYQWNGPKMSRMKASKALDLTTRLRDERSR